MDKLQTMAESDIPTKYTTLQTMTPVVTEHWTGTLQYWKKK